MTLLSAGQVLPTQPLVLRVMGDLTLAATVDHSSATSALLELHLACRLVQLVMLTAVVGASNELPGQLHVDSIIHIQDHHRHAHAQIKTVLNIKIYERALAGRSRGGVADNPEDHHPYREHRHGCTSSRNTNPYVGHINIVPDFRHSCRQLWGKANSRGWDREAFLNQCGRGNNPDPVGIGVSIYMCT